jgi:predicted nucleotidyltransferase
MTVDREKVLVALREKRNDIERRYGLRMVGIIGSVARGQATEQSDVDVFVDVVRTPTLFEMAGAEIELQDAMGSTLPVQFVFREDLRPAMRARMERDLIPL